jgi:hypothetical protein
MQYIRAPEYGCLDDATMIRAGSLVLQKLYFQANTARLLVWLTTLCLGKVIFDSHGTEVIKVCYCSDNALKACVILGYLVAHCCFIFFC